MTKLGKHPYVSDARSLKLQDYTKGLPAPAPSVKWSDRVSLWPMFGNGPDPTFPQAPNGCGDCAEASPGHLLESWSADNGTEVAVTTAEIIAAYSAITGYNPDAPLDANGNNPTDQGSQLIDVLKYWRSVGIAGQKIGAFAEVLPHDHQTIRQAIEVFGGVNVGFVLPAAAQQMSNRWTSPPRSAYSRGPWYWPFSAPRLQGEWVAGSWGGHCVCVLDYTPTTYTCVSWGQLVEIEVGFWEAYVDEVWAIIAPAFMASGRSPGGFDMTTMLSDLGEVGKIVPFPSATP